MKDWSSNNNDIIVEENCNAYTDFNDKGITDYWKEIESLNWYWISKRDSTLNPNDELAEILMDSYDVDEIIEMKNFVVKKRDILKYFLLGYFKSSPSDFKNKIKMSDDGLWDFCAHMVGLGEVMYNYVLDHPDSVVELQKDYIENFEYGFDIALYKLKTEE